MLTVDRGGVTKIGHDTVIVAKYGHMVRNPQPKDVTGPVDIEAVMSLQAKIASGRSGF